MVNAVIKIVPKTSKSGNPYNTLEIYIDNMLVKSNIYVSDAEKTLIDILSK